jgi:hypothetical protein
VQVLDLTVRWGCFTDVDTSQSGNMPDGVLEKRPNPAGLVEALVVEADGQKAVEFVKNVEYVEVERRPGILVVYDLSLPSRLDARPDIRLPIYLHEAIGTITGNAKQATRSVIFETTGKSVYSGGIEGGPDTLASECGNSPAFESKGQRATRID